MPAPKAWLVAKERWDGVPRALWSPEVKVPGLSKAVYAYLVSEATTEMRAFPAQAKIMAAVQVGSDNTVRKALDDLLGHNMLELLEARRRGDDGQWKPATYRILPPRDWTFPPSAESAEGEPPEPPAETAPGPPAETAEGDGVPIDPPSAESAAHQDVRENPEMRARARDGGGARALPEMPTVTLPFSRAESWVEFWERAASSAGRVRIRLEELRLCVDVYSPTEEHGGALLVWREGPLPGPGETLPQAMEAFNRDADAFWQALIPQIGVKRAQGWREGHAPFTEGYPMRSRGYFERRRE